MPHLPPALPRETTQELLQQYVAAVSAQGPAAVQDGPIETRLFNGNLRFAARVAARFRDAGHALGFDLEDLFAEASMALLDAIRKYDPRWSADPMGANSFSGWSSRLMHQRLVAFVKARENSQPDPMRDAASFDSAVSTGDGSSGASLADLLPDDAEDLSLTVERSLAAQRALAAIASLPEREATVLRLRFGLAGCAPHEVAEIAAVLGVSRQRAQVIEKRALARLRDRLGVTAEATPGDEAAA